MSAEHVTPAVIYELPPALLSTIDVLDEVMTERRRQEQRWGQQDHPWNAGRSKPVQYLLGVTWSGADEVKTMVEEQHRRGELGYVEILFEEVAEAMDEYDIRRVREELVQVAAVAVAAIESIDRNGR